jgi:hypothetical protein
MSESVESDVVQINGHEALAMGGDATKFRLEPLRGRRGRAIPRGTGLRAHDSEVLRPLARASHQNWLEPDVGWNQRRATTKQGERAYRLRC